MKFGKSLESDVQGLPEEWRQYILQYKDLKKQIRAIVSELQLKGVHLAPGEVKAVLDCAATVDPDGQALYSLEEVDGVLVATLRIHNNDGRMETLATLPLSNANSRSSSPLVSSSSSPPPLSSSPLEALDLRGTAEDPVSDLLPELASITLREEDDLPPRTRSGSQQVMVPLEQDAEFFASLNSQIHEADAFCDRTRDAFAHRVDDLAGTLTVAASPRDKDMYAWREIIRIFLDADIWMELTPTGRRERSAAEALRAFSDFRHHLLGSGRVKALRLPASRDAYIHFVRMVEELVAVKRFQELNALAMRKILKKHDKRTNLTAQVTFPQLLLTDPFFTQEVARSIAATISDRIIPIIPQLDDYLCPVCYALVWKPVRLTCGHVFCVRCLVKAQRTGLKDCPVCRSSTAVEQAHADNMDASLLNLLELYFPKELKEKRRDAEKEVAMEEAAMLRGAPLSIQPRTSRRDGAEGCILM